MMGLHCFTEQKQFIHSLLPVLIENHIVLWALSLPSKMKDTVAVYQAKGGRCIHLTSICKTPVTCWALVIDTGDTAVNKVYQSLVLPQKHNQGFEVLEWTSHYFHFYFFLAILFHKITGYWPSLTPESTTADEDFSDRGKVQFPATRKDK